LDSKISKEDKADNRSLVAFDGSACPQLGQHISEGCAEPAFISKEALQVQVIFTNI